ncbi:MAG: ABC transporter substrate-binding protein [Pararhodobacter sp.]
MSARIATGKSALSRRSVLGGIGAAAAVTLSGLPARTQSLTRVHISTALRLANYTPAYIALREGIFEKHGLAVEVTAASSVAEPISILNAGRAEFAMTGTGMAVNSAIEGADTKVIAKMAGAIGLWFISRPGVRVTSLDDLKGKTIASYRFPSNTVSSPTYAMRSVGGFDPAATGVRFLEGPFGSIIPAVVDGRADLGCVFEWDASIAEVVHGLEVSLPLAEVLGPIAFTSTLVSSRYAERNPEVVQAFVNALAESMELLHADPEVYRRVSTAEFDQVPPEAIAAGTQRLLSAEGVVPRNPMITREEWDAIIAHDTAAGTVRGERTYDQLVDMSFAQRAIEVIANGG